MNNFKDEFVNSAYSDMKACLEKSNKLPSLQQLSTTTIATSLWNNNSIKRQVNTYLTFEKERHDSMQIGWSGMLQFIEQTSQRKHKNWKVIEKKVQTQSDQLNLPIRLKRHLDYTIIMISSQLKKWLLYLIKLIEWTHKESEFIIRSIVWTATGTIDKERTINLLAHNETLKANGSLFELACTFCLEKTVKCLWEQLPEPLKEKIQSKGSLAERSRYQVFGQTLFEYFWKGISNMMGVFNTLSDRECENLLIKYSKEGTSDLALKYLWYHLTLDERQELIEEWFSKGLSYNSDRFYFYLNHVTETELLAGIENNAADMLECLLRDMRPWQQDFMPAVVSLLKLVDETDLCSIVLRILDGVCDHKYCNKTGLLLVLGNCGLEFRRKLFSENSEKLLNLLQVKEFNVVKELLADITEKDKYEMIKLWIEGEM